MCKLWRENGSGIKMSELKKRKRRIMNLCPELQQS